MTDSEKGSPQNENAEGGQPRPEGDSLSAKPEDPHTENAETRPPAGEYGVVPSKREELASSFATDRLHPFGQGPRGIAGATSIWQARLSQPSIEPMRKPASNPTRVYVAVGVALGLLVGLAASFTFLHPSGSGPNDLGAVNAVEYGLRGHLSTSWKEKLEYELTVEPGDPSQRAAFSFDVNASPRPLSVAVQVKDASGAVLCRDVVLLKFNPRNASYSATINPWPEAGRLKGENAARDEIAQGTRLAREESQELDREHGRSLFQNIVGPDGQIASISAQGTLPCTRKQFENIASWSFTSDFPVVSMPAQDRTASPKPDAHGELSTVGESSETGRAVVKPAPAGAAKRRPAPAFPPIYVEGDDAIVWFDSSTGVIETSAGKALVIDKTDAVATTLKGRDLPVPIHYRCEQSGACMFAGVGADAEHARLRR